jgi:hypothetical protein
MGTIYLDGICYSSGGGGGASSADQVSLDDTNLAYVADDVQEAFEKVTKSLTYAEYQELTEEEKNNGTIYLITDVNGDGQTFQPVIYSTEEREIGVWTDGKPLYEKTFYSNMVIPYDSASAVTLNDTIPSNIEVVDIQAYFRGKNVGGNQLYQSDGGNWFRYYYESTDNKIYASQIFTSGGVTNCKTYFTFRYTKTTDQPGSGTWTPQGVPAVHYSTEEQVVGTWIDGSTLYEKTVPLQSTITLTANTWTNLVDVSALNINNLVSATAQASTSLAVMSPYAQIANGMLQAFLPFNWYISLVTIRYTKSNT